MHRGGGGEKEAKSIGLTPYPVLCRHFRATLCHESVMPVKRACHSPKMKKVHFYIFTFLQRNTYLNGILNKEGNMECYIIIIIYYIIIYYNIIYNNSINRF